MFKGSLKPLKFSHLATVWLLILIIWPLMVWSKGCLTRWPSDHLLCHSKKDHIMISRNDLSFPHWVRLTLVLHSGPISRSVNPLLFGQFRSQKDASQANSSEHLQSSCIVAGGSVIQHIKYTGIGRKHMGQFKHSLFVFLSKIHDSLIPYQSSIVQIMWLSL